MQEISNYTEGYRRTTSGRRTKAEQFVKEAFSGGPWTVRIHNGKKVTIDERDCWIVAVCDSWGNPVLDEATGRYVGITEGFSTPEEALFEARQMALRLKIPQDRVEIRDTRAQGPGHTLSYADQFRYEIWKAVEKEMGPRDIYPSNYDWDVQREVNRRLKAKRGGAK